MVNGVKHYLFMFACTHRSQGDCLRSFGDLARHVDFCISCFSLDVDITVVFHILVLVGGWMVFLSPFFVPTAEAFNNVLGRSPISEFVHHQRPQCVKQVRCSKMDSIHSL